MVIVPGVRVIEFARIVCSKSPISPECNLRIAGLIGFRKRTIKLATSKFAIATTQAYLTSAIIRLGVFLKGNGGLENDALRIPSLRHIKRNTAKKTPARAVAQCKVLPKNTQTADNNPINNIIRAGIDYYTSTRLTAFM